MNTWSRKISTTVSLAIMLCLTGMVMSGEAEAWQSQDNADGSVFSCGTNEVTRFQPGQWQIVADLRTACNNCKARCKYGYFPGGYCLCVLEYCDMECDYLPECPPAKQGMDECTDYCRYNEECKICCIEFAANESQGKCKDCYDDYKQCLGKSSGTCAENFNICKYQYQCPYVYFTHNCRK